MHQVRVLLLTRGCCVDQGYSQLQIIPRTFLRALFKGKVNAGITINIRSFPEFVFSVSYSWGIFRRHGKGAVVLEQLTETPEV